jgi:isoleucyl-tRNA synthetase
VFLETWAQLPREALEQPNIDWDAILDLRGAVSRELEKLRNTGSIGAPLDARIDLYVQGEMLDVLRSFGQELRFIFITSEAQVHNANERPSHAVAASEGDTNYAWIAVSATDAQKCIRCWHKRPDVGSNAEHPQICGRCVSNVTGDGEPRRWT